MLVNKCTDMWMWMYVKVQVQHGGAASTSPAGGVQHRGKGVAPVNIFLFRPGS